MRSDSIVLNPKAIERAKPLRDLRDRWAAQVLLGLGLTLPIVAVVIAKAAGLIPTDRAAILLIAPAVGLVVIIRPTWLIFALAAVPSALVAYVPSLAMMLVLAAALVAHLAIRGRLSFGIKTGMVPLLALMVLARLFTAESAGEAALMARGFLNVFTYLVMLGLLTFNLVSLGDLNVRHLANALLLGSGITVILERTGLAVSQVAEQSVNAGISSIGRNVAYVAVMGFGIAFARLVLPDPDMRPRHKIFYAVLSASFALVAAQALVRAAWLSGLIIVFLVAVWARKPRYWILIAMIAVLMLFIPVARERVIPDHRGGIAEAVTSSTYTTGRWELWRILRDDAADALPAGHGYGYTFTLSPEQLFGFQAFVGEGDDNRFVYPHNDFLFWTLELGIVGLVALTVFWVHLVRTLSWLSGHAPYDLRYDAYVLGGIVVMVFVIQMVDNSFAIRAVGERFFMATGAIFGLAAAARNHARSARRPQVTFHPT